MRSQQNQRIIPMEFVVYYASVIDDEEDGIFVNAPFLGGFSITREGADILAKDIVNDRLLPGVIITKIFPCSDRGQILSLATKQFNQMARDMYDVEDSIHRKRK